MRRIFEKMKSIPKSEVISFGLSEYEQEQEALYKTAIRDYTKAADDLASLKGEVLRSIKGESKFTPNLLSELITEAEKRFAEIETVRNNAKQELDGSPHTGNASKI